MERGRSQVWLSLVAVSLLASTLMGCGGSSTNWADAARRGRSEDEFGGYSNNATANTTADDAEATTTENNAAAATGASSQEVATQPEPDSGVADLSTLALPSGVADGDEDSLGDYLERMNAIGKAFAQEMSATSHMPRTWERDSDGDPGLSWRVRILPLLGHQELYDKFKLDEPWDSPHNIQLVRYMPGEFRSGSTEVGKTCFQLPIATYTPFPPGGLPVKVVDISHGMGATIMMVQTKPERAVFWTAPTDYIPPERNNADGLALSKENTYLVLWGSGQAEEIKSDVGANLYHCMFTARGPADVFDPLAVAAHPPAAPAGPGSTSEVGPEAVVSTGASVETPTARPAEPRRSPPSASLSPAARNDSKSPSELSATAGTVASGASSVGATPSSVSGSGTAAGAGAVTVKLKLPLIGCASGACTDQRKPTVPPVTAGSNRSFHDLPSSVLASAGSRSSPLESSNWKPSPAGSASPVKLRVTTSTGLSTEAPSGGSDDSNPVWAPAGLAIPTTPRTATRVARIRRGTNRTVTSEVGGVMDRSKLHRLLRHNTTIRHTVVTRTSTPYTRRSRINYIVS